MPASDISPYTIVPATVDHAPMLPGIERAAARLFPPELLPAHLYDDINPESNFADAAREGRLLVALDATGAPVGFALLEIVDGQTHLEELDVLPAHGRRGLGRALVNATIEWAREHGHAAVTLTTFRDVPWNEPFYRSAGFLPLDDRDIGPELAQIIRHELENGLHPAHRVAMRLTLSGERA